MREMLTGRVFTGLYWHALGYVVVVAAGHEITLTNSDAFTAFSKPKRVDGQYCLRRRNGARTPSEHHASDSDRKGSRPGEKTKDPAQRLLRRSEEPLQRIFREQIGFKIHGIPNRSFAESGHLVSVRYDP